MQSQSKNVTSAACTKTISSILIIDYSVTKYIFYVGLTCIGYYGRAKKIITKHSSVDVPHISH